MKINFLVFAIGGSLPLASLTLRGQVTNTNALPLNQTLRYQVALENDRPLGEHALLPPGLQRDRDAAVKKIKPLLTPEQLLILDHKNNQWRKKNGSQANDPSAN